MKLEPAPTEAWVKTAVKYTAIPLDDAQREPWFVPPVDLITGVASLQKAKEFVAMWRLIRHAWLYEAFAHCMPPDFATRKAWKTFSTGSFSEPSPNLKSGTSIARVKFTEFMHLQNVGSTRATHWHNRRKVPKAMVRGTARARRPRIFLRRVQGRIPPNLLLAGRDCGEIAAGHGSCPLPLSPFCSEFLSQRSQNVPPGWVVFAI